MVNFGLRRLSNGREIIPDCGWLGLQDPSQYWKLNEKEEKIWLFLVSLSDLFSYGLWLPSLTLDQFTFGYSNKIALVCAFPQRRLSLMWPSAKSPALLNPFISHLDHLFFLHSILFFYSYIFSKPPEWEHVIKYLSSNENAHTFNKSKMARTILIYNCTVGRIQLSSIKNK